MNDLVTEPISNRVSGPGARPWSAPVLAGTPDLRGVFRHDGHHRADALLGQPVRGLLGEGSKFLCHDGHHGCVPRATGAP